MNKLKRGMVIDINLDPIRGSETGKIRPCVIVTNDVYNARSFKLFRKLDLSAVR